MSYMLCGGNIGQASDTITGLDIECGNGETATCLASLGMPAYQDWIHCTSLHSTASIMRYARLALPSRAETTLTASHVPWQYQHAHKTANTTPFIHSPHSPTSAPTRNSTHVATYLSIPSRSRCYHQSEHSALLSLACQGNLLQVLCQRLLDCSYQSQRRCPNVLELSPRRMLGRVRTDLT
jgi:hypothetical protein